MSHSSAISEVMKKFLEELKDRTCCPTCFERFTGHILMCKAGHSVCQQCKNKLKKCTFCKKKWNKNAKNYMAESITELFDQTEKDLIKHDSIKNCRIYDCDQEYPKPDLIYHVMQEHVRQLVQWEQEGTRNFFTFLPLYYRRGMTYDYASLVGHLGLFFINVLIKSNGSIRAAITAVELPPEEFDCYVYLDINDKNPIKGSAKIRTYTKSEDKYSGPIKFSRTLFEDVNEDTKFHMRINILAAVVPVPERHE